MVESPTGPWSSHSCFEATPSIQVSIKIIKTGKIEQTEENNKEEDFRNICVNSVEMSERPVNCKYILHKLFLMLTKSIFFNPK